MSSTNTGLNGVAAVLFVRCKECFFTVSHWRHPGGKLAVWMSAGNPNAHLVPKMIGPGKILDLKISGGCHGYGMGCF